MTSVQEGVTERERERERERGNGKVLCMAHPSLTLRGSSATVGERRPFFFQLTRERRTNGLPSREAAPLSALKAKCNALLWLE